MRDLKRVPMRLRYVIFVLFSLLVSGSWTQDVNVFNVMTLNVRFDNPEDGVNNWKYRHSFISDLIVQNNSDIVGTQEILYAQLMDLQRELSAYNHVGVGREDGQLKGEYTAIFYLKERFDLIDSGTFWLSETPEIVASTGWDAAMERICTWVILEDRKTKVKLAIFNTHFDHIGSLARYESASLLLEKINILANGRPIVLMGDFNAPPDSEPIHRITQGNFLINSYDIAKEHKGPTWSFHGFGQVPEEKRLTIDYIFVSSQFIVPLHCTVFQKMEGTYPSDHNPVLARLVYKIN